MFRSILVRLCTLLAVISGLARAENPGAEAICRKVAETYRNLRMYQFAAQLTIDYNLRGSSASGETHYALAMVKPDKIRLTKTDQDRELIIVSDGETTWKYLPRTKQYTRESVATLEDEEQSEQPSRGEVDPLTEAQNKLVNRYIGLVRYASVAVLAREDRLKVEGDRVDCFVLQIRLPAGVQGIWVDKQRFPVLRHMENAKVERNGV